MDGNFVDVEVQNLTRQGVGRMLGLAPTLLRCQLLKKIDPESRDADDRAGAERKRRRKPSSATDRPSTQHKRRRNTDDGAGAEGIRRRKLSSATDSTPTVVQLGSTGCKYELLHDSRCLTELLMACSSASTLLPDVTNQHDLLTHMNEFASALANFPSFMRFGGDYIGPTVLHKHLLGLLAGVPVQWQDISRATLDSWSVDKGNHLSTVPASWTVAELQTELDVEPIYISMWCCLLRDVERLGPRATHACRFRVAELHTLLATFKDKHGIPPCPYILVSELLAADDKFINHRSRADARSEWLQAKLKAQGLESEPRTPFAACEKDQVDDAVVDGIRHNQQQQL